jgi:outer membrane protein assembly factor BamB
MTRLTTLRLALVVALVVAVVGVATVAFTSPSTTARFVQPPGGVPAQTASKPPPFQGWSDPARVGRPYSDKVSGLLTFRGNPTRTFYGTGPVPRVKPGQRWQFPRSGGLCSISSDETGPHEWCGSGFPGQPAVFERDGRTWVVFGAYDAKVHFLDAETGERILPDFTTGDLIKGSVTIDPDGFPLVYAGSRDNFYRVLAIDRQRPTELWKLSAKAVSPTMWNDDWDGAGIILDDYLFIGGENSQFHVVKLNRGYGPDGKVTVAPKLVFHAPGWDSQLLRDIGNNNVSIESSVAVYGNTVYFANSGGLVQGWDISGLKEGRNPERVFRFWTGDDTDAAVVVDEAGFLYVGSQFERRNARAREVGQMMKLDPRKPDNPIVWSIKDQVGTPAGVWGTAALHRDIVIFDTTGGDVLGVDRDNGEVRWKFRLPGPLWQSPVVVDNVLLLGGGCSGVLHAYDVADTRVQPKPLWTINIGGCVESTPAVWRGSVYLGTRSGAVHAYGA